MGSEMCIRDRSPLRNLAFLKRQFFRLTALFRKDNMLSINGPGLVLLFERKADELCRLCFTQCNAMQCIVNGRVIHTIKFILTLNYFKQFFLVDLICVLVFSLTAVQFIISMYVIPIFVHICRSTSQI